MRVFGTAGIRGVFNSTQIPEQVCDVALSSAFAFGKGVYGVGWDGRKSSQVLARAAAAGACAAGSNAKLFGMVPTPVTAYATREGGCKLGFSVTASHNPPEYSGVKMFDSRGMELSREYEDRIERVMTVQVNKCVRNFGVITYSDYLDQYVRSMVARFQGSAMAMKVVVDCANGPGVLVTPRVLQELGHDVITVNGQVSWRFPAHLPEPTPQTLTDTAAIVAGSGADLGFVHDGDADRLVMINAAGRILPDSMVSIIALRGLVGSRGSGTIVLSENTSSAVEEEAVRLGLRVVRSRIGKTFAEIEKECAFFATEPSKVVNPEWGMWEDGMFCAALITNSIARNAELLDLAYSEPSWHYKQVNMSVSVDFGKLVREAEAVFGEFGISEVRRLDGVKLIFKDQSWIMFRASGTEPKVRIYCESRDPVRLGQLLERGTRLLEEFSLQRVR